MAPDLSPDAWARVRHDYELTDTPVEDICAQHGISSGTLRNRMRRWNWMRRRPPIPAEGPLPAPALDPSPSADRERIEADESAAPLPAAAPERETASLSPPAADADDPGAIVPRLEQAIARVLPAIAANLARLAAQPAHPREMERAARALGALTRTLRELTTLLAEHQARAAAGHGRICDCADMPEDIDEFRLDLVRKMNAIIASRDARHAEAEDGGAAPAPREP